MNYKELLLLSMLFPSVVFAQTQAFSFPTGSVYKAGSFVIKGQLKNTKDTIFDFGLTDFIGDKLNSVVVKSDGSFQQRFPIRYRRMRFFLTILTAVVLRLL